MILLFQVLPQITTLATFGTDFDPAILFPQKRTRNNLRHLSLNVHSNPSSLFDHRQWDLESLHLSIWMIKDLDEEVISRLIKIAKGRDPKNRIERIVIHGSKKRMAAGHTGYDIDVFEWREDQAEPAFEDFDESQA